MTIARSDLEAVHDFASSHATVEARVRAALSTPTGTLAFLFRYAEWNGYFGSAVASLAGKIGRSRRVFLDPEAEVTELADRSVLVGSYFFDAARDEFNDRDTTHRDTHRCLAQATVTGLARPFRAEVLMDALRVPDWLDVVGHRVAHGYGVGSPDSAGDIFRAMGYHLGSEVLADQEFTTVDRILREVAPDVVTHLSATQVVIAGQTHNAYSWIRIHSGGGNAVEADHFAWAVEGVNVALRYTPAPQRDAAVYQVLQGFADFARDHAEFFAMVNK